MKQWLIDTAERTASTFVQVFIGLMLASGTDWLNLSAIRAAGIGAGVAALTVVKSAIASRFADTISPASLVKPATEG